LVTGVEVVSAKDQIQIIFGCWSGFASNGGVGYITANSDWSNKQIQAIVDKNGPIIGGSVGVIESCEPSKKKMRKSILQELFNL
jgi:hypothetical protein